MAELLPGDRIAFVEQGIMPPGWRWCPDCNGEGVISTMEANPDLTEHERPCHRCEAEQGIVPVCITRGDQ